MALKHDYPPDFERLWQLYPRKINKPVALKEFQKLDLSPADVDELANHIAKRVRLDKQWVPDKNGKSFVPYMERFFRYRKWEDEYQQTREVRGYDKTTVEHHAPIDREAADRARDRAMAELRGMLH